jgi:Tfp pilus assembly protein PilX
MHARNERGVALVIAMFMMVIVSALGAAMVHVARTETLSTANYTSMSQARYAAESGLAAAANYLLSAGFEAVAPGTAGDPLSNYNLTISPVTRIANATPVVLSSDASTADNYPLTAVVNAFQTASSGTLGVGQGTAAYSARARLLSMRQIVDAYSGQPRLLQTWEITGVGRRAQGLVSGEVEVSAIIDRSTRPVFNYAGYATGNGCGAIAFSGNASTRSYDSRTAAPGNSAPATQDSGGHVGSNGNLSGGGSADIHGTMSTPRAGVGNCTANNVTAATVAALGTVSDGLIQLPQPIEFPTPAAPNPMPPTSDLTINGSTCPAAYVLVCSSGGGKTTWDPLLSGGTISMGNVSLSGNAQVYLKAGTYVMNSLTISGNTKIIVDESSGGPVRIVLAGKNSDGTDMSSAVFSVTGNGVGNTTWDPTALRIEYAGTGTMNFAGNGDTSALIYAPNATGNFTGNADFFGSVIMRQLNFGGSTVISYDRALQQSAVTVGNAMMTTFTWRTF